MTVRILFESLLLLVLTLLLQCGCADPVQIQGADRDDIPSTIGSAQDSSTSETVASNQTTGDLESNEPAKQDLATLLRTEEAEFKKQSIEIPSTWKRLSEVSHIWADKENKRVIVRGAICLDEGLLEMFACPRDTKEHEAIISVHAKAWETHATLVALGIDPGKPMTWMEEYVSVTGPVIDIEVWWMEEGKLIKRRAQDMIQNTDTEKAMACDFVFGGSEQRFDPAKKGNDYMADYGPMINVANQPDAMIDVSIESSAAAQGSMFAAFTKNVPPVNTKVYIVLSDSGKKVVKGTIGKQ